MKATQKVEGAIQGEISAVVDCITKQEEERRLKVNSQLDKRQKQLGMLSFAANDPGKRHS